MKHLSRRGFLKTSAATGALSVASARGLLPSQSSSQATPRTKLDQFSYGDVQLLEGPMLDQFNTNHSFFLGMSDDALLKPFRQAAGMAAPGEDMGGWYSFSKEFDPPRNMTGYIPGHSFGQYLSGLSRAYAITGSRPTQEKVHGLVQGFAPTVSKKFYVGYCLPAYTFDKTNCGLIDAHAFAGSPIALDVLNHATDAVLPFLPDRALTRQEMAARPHPNIAYTWDESYTLPENLFLAYKRGAGQRFQQLAIRYLQNEKYFDPLAAGENILPGEHAYSHVNALNSAAQAWLVLGSEKHLRAARNGFDFVRTTQSFATGGWGPDETFRAPGSGDMGKSLVKTHSSFETPCGSYGHFKIARYLMRASGDSRYGDSMEMVLYNTILGAKPIQKDGHSFYYSDYNNSGSKFFHPDKWPCCSGTFPQITADYGISSYFRDPGGVYVNLYVPSRVTWRQGSARVSLAQKTDYPYSPETSLEVTTDRPEGFAIRLRVPAWAGSKSVLTVNGRRTNAELTPGTWATVRQTWKSGDRVELSLDMPLQLQAIDAQHPRTVALMQGPLTLFAIGDITGNFTRQQLMAARQTAAGSKEWTVDSSSGNVRMVAFPFIQDEKYRLYHELEA